MTKVLMKGNEAIGEAAILAGCRHYFGHPMPPQSELLAYLAKRLPEVNGVFLQAENETAAIHMTYGAGSAGARVMTSSSSPGMSLFQEGISHMAGAEIPCVIADIMRGGPGLGNVSAAQADYWQAVKCGGHSDYRTIVFAPASVQEMIDMTISAFDYADRYRNPVVILADGVLAQMMEPVTLPAPTDHTPDSKKWALGNNFKEKKSGNYSTSIFKAKEELEEHNWGLYQKYQVISDHFRKDKPELTYEEYLCEDADIILTGYGIIARVLQTVVEKCRKRGIKAGLLRPKTLWPFPVEAFQQYAETASMFLAVEMSCGQMVEDVKLALNGKKPVYFFGRAGGSVPSDFEIFNEVDKLAGRN